MNKLVNRIMSGVLLLSLVVGHTVPAFSWKTGPSM